MSQFDSFKAKSHSFNLVLTKLSNKKKEYSHSSSRLGTRSLESEAVLLRPMKSNNP
jgi:hypothetical protein